MKYVVRWQHSRRLEKLAAMRADSDAGLVPSGAAFGGSVLADAAGRFEADGKGVGAGVSDVAAVADGASAVVLQSEREAVVRPRTAVGAAQDRV